VHEFDIIERYFKREHHDPDIVLGVGDDAAVLAIDGLMAVTVDTLVEGVHFPHGMAPHLLGHRLMAVNLSDLAAMGAEPRWATLALTLPSADELWLDGFSRGLHELANRFGVALVGGDLTRGPLTVTLQLMGRVERASMLTRGGGNLGDDVYVTGSLGDSAAGIALIMEREEPNQGSAAAALEERFYRPMPRVAEGRALGPLASAAIDISDGLLADLGHVCNASGTGAEIDLAALPASDALASRFDAEARRAVQSTGGDDYELCFTAPPSRREAIAGLATRCATSMTRVGRIVAGEGVRALLPDGSEWAAPRAGHVHFE
jgi:thiamine-monophosphate kinase